MDTSSFRAARLTSLLLLIATVGLGWKARAQTILVASNAVWRYLDDGSNQGEVWREFFFEDENWAAGPAELGYGDAVEGRPEATLLNYGGNPNNRFITYYFRHSFYLEDASLVTNLVARLLRDDGAVVYLNESEIIRSNMPAGPINFLTLASPPGVASGPEEYTFYPSRIDPALLLPGWNVLAVEVHQHSPTSADVSFALELLAGVGEPPPVPLVLTRGPYLQGGSPTNIIVRWRTSVPTDSRVQFSTSLVDFGYTVVDPVVSTNHSVNLIGLAPDTKYYYRVGSTGTNLAGGTNHYFVTSPLAGKPTRIWALGDCGTASAAGYEAFDHVRETRAAYEAFTTARRTDLWLLLGDNAYFTGEDSQYQTAIFDIFTNQLPNTVLWSTVGNHEALATASPQLPYFEIFDFPRNGEAGGVASGTEKYYSFDYGNVHLVCLDSELTLRTPASPMWTWLAQDLAANTKDWTLVIWHSPPYSDGSHNSDYEFQLAYMRENALPILDAYGVDLVLCGHSHNYERSFLLDGHYGMSHTLTPAMIKDAGGGQVGETGAYVKAGAGSEPRQGAVYVVAGNAGWTLGANHQPSHAAMYYSALTVGSLVIDVNGNRLDAKYLNSNGDVDDEFTIIKGAAPEPLRVTAFVKDGDNVTIAWRSRVGQAYRVQRAAALASVTNWQPASPVITATGATTSWTTDEDGNPPANFYRIVEIAD